MVSQNVVLLPRVSETELKIGITKEINHTIPYPYTMELEAILSEIILHEETMEIKMGNINLFIQLE